MSCNGCRVLRKGCSETCTLRSSIQWIENPEAQGYATLFVAKFFGRADLMSFISAVPHHQRPALFQSLLFEACGRTVNPVNGAVGLLMSGNWHICQAAVQTVFSGGILRPISPELLSRVLTINTNSHHQPNNNNKPEQKTTSNTPDVFRIDDSSNRNMSFQLPIPNVYNNQAYNKAQRNGSAVVHSQRSSLMKMAEEEEEDGRRRQIMNNRDSSPSEVSGTTGSFENYEAAATVGINGGQKRKLLNLFI